MVLPCSCSWGSWAPLQGELSHAKAAAVTSVPAPHSLREGLCAAACNCRKCSISLWTRNIHSRYISHSGVGPENSKLALRISCLGNNSCLKLGPFSYAWLMVWYWWGRVPVSFWAAFMGCRWAPWHCLQLLLGFSSSFFLFKFFFWQLVAGSI